MLYLFLAVRRVRGAYRVVAYNEQELTEKVSHGIG